MVLQQTDANFLNTTATGTVAGITWNLNTGSTPDDITLAVSTASGTVAGIVNTSAQTFAGVKTFNNTLNVTTLNRTSANLTIQTTTSGDIALNPAGNVTLGTSDTTGNLLVLDTKTNSGDPTEYKVQCTTMQTQINSAATKMVHG